MKTSEFFSECLQIFSIFTGTYNTTKSEMVAANTEPLAGNNPADPDINQLTMLRHKWPNKFGLWITWKRGLLPVIISWPVQFGLRFGPSCRCLCEVLHLPISKTTLLSLASLTSWARCQRRQRWVFLQDGHLGSTRSLCLIKTRHIFDVLGKTPKMPVRLLKMCSKTYKT
jgi:hypothetical protein